ncbi:Zn-dependent peptidase ImmA (M78 family) [Actinomadura pelletieri DSM 43383]|uniref:Zn-dependent peptidase ImmA (M78 family) n=1 Tax=Actinomadura pelletieri DSM 43383 TaxID=1120940 RepID=A0A495QZD5_9ACTN|nr:XRE family transcriptional regulator [Actinomadura pelletieri]RKS79427.1 Zn-dependent peptidase ImmA (M78 family) [Actinomadura pelletieri DSM 43383]
MGSVENWAEVGGRVREARLAHDLSQTELARRLDLERTAVVRIESGRRQISAIELFKLSDVLGVPAAHFVTQSPPAVVSQRQALTEDADSASRTRFQIDAALESHARDTGRLIDHELLAKAAPASALRAKNRKEARRLAADIRKQARLGDDPIGGMAELSERFGLYVLVLDTDTEGASLLLDGYGVAVLGGRRAPGRRRFTAAHELGHHLLHDAYHTDIGVAASLQEREAVINAFAAELLLPSPVLKRIARSENPREELIRLAGMYRVSWSVVVGEAERMKLFSPDQLTALRTDTPVKGEFLAVLGEEPKPDLEIGDTGPAWRRAVLAAWERSLITASRAVELLKGQITVAELPPRPSHRDAE